MKDLDLNHLLLTCHPFLRVRATPGGTGAIACPTTGSDGESLSIRFWRLPMNLARRNWACYCTVKDAESKRVATSRIRVLLTIPNSTTQRHEFLQLSWEKTVSAESILGEDMSDLPR